ncbi:DUF1127 domain-containing protein [Bradyrhizobium sp. 1(2017)]|uniref:DUF1127 domain-containing protein n=1 Tax=Bradyrhizobium sp. 1(2017) TaxID=1404888 RepID=UPI002FE5264C
MSSIHQTTARESVKRQVYSPIETYWDAFQEWRKRETSRTQLCRLTERELADIGITRGEIDYVASKRGLATPHHARGWHAGALVILMFCNACILVFASEAGAQCTARDVLQVRPVLKEAAGVRKPQIVTGSAADVPVWRKTTVGTFPDSVALRNALNARGCGVGDLAGEIMARPAFTLSATKTDLELVTVSAAELGFQTEMVSLGQIHARAQQLGFGLAPAEIAPQLRLQYLDQPIGEFLIIGMDPIKTWKGQPVILTVANGGAGLILIGQDGRADVEMFVGSRFVFLRSNEAAPAEATLVHR